MIWFSVCCSLLVIAGSEPSAAASPGEGSSPPEFVWLSSNGQVVIRGTVVTGARDVTLVRQGDGSVQMVRTAGLSQIACPSADLSIQTRNAQSPALSGSMRWKPKQVNEVSATAPARDQIEEAFAAFVKSGAIQTRRDENTFFVESNGIPDHPMMVGIRSWQQQVPLPHPYRGENSWQIPLHPRPAANPRSTKGAFLRGAIALAVNGIPIFNPLNNRGDDAFLAGELDEYGGHCGRADDYHYHLPPIHLEQTNGADKPIAYALDGYPIFGLTEADGSRPENLDRFHGHHDAAGSYHYHASQAYPYLNGGFYGEVVEREGQVDPQPRAEPIRAYLQPLRGAKIVGFESTGEQAYKLTYQVGQQEGSVSYVWDPNGSVTFEFTNPQGQTRRETYSPRRNDRKPAPLPSANSPNSEKSKRERGEPNPKTGAQFSISSSSVGQDGRLEVDCTCDGQRRTPAIAWTNLPAGTKYLALSLWHTAPDQEKSYWLVYDIPATSNGLKENQRDIGVIGRNGKGQQSYDPPCSKGPGLKTYHLTVFALSEKLDLDPRQTDRQTLLKEVAAEKLAEFTLDFTYERMGAGK